jgi:hypothetical protein
LSVTSNKPPERIMALYLVSYNQEYQTNKRIKLGQISSPIFIISGSGKHSLIPTRITKTRLTYLEIIFYSSFISKSPATPTAACVILKHLTCPKHINIWLQFC